jgi:hypothetical protein
LVIAAFNSVPLFVDQAMHVRFQNLVIRGGDPVLCEQLFSPNPPAHPFQRAASHVDGAASILLGIAANHSIASGLPVS